MIKYKGWKISGKNKQYYWTTDYRLKGNPTCEADIVHLMVFWERCSPPGASTGKLEALELRDGVKNRYFGKSVENAISKINNEILKKIDRSATYSQEDFDNFLIELDGTDNKSNLGANSILALSIAFAKALADHKKKYLFQSLVDNSSYVMPTPMMNIINGGAHANNKLDFQEFMILPVHFDTIKETIRAGSEIFHSLKSRLDRLGMSTSVGDEGGFAPDLKNNKEVSKS